MDTYSWNTMTYDQPTQHPSCDEARTQFMSQFADLEKIAVQFYTTLNSNFQYHMFVTHIKKLLDLQTTHETVSTVIEELLRHDYDFNQIKSACFAAKANKTLIVFFHLKCLLLTTRNVPATSNDSEKFDLSEPFGTIIRKNVMFPHKGEDMLMRSIEFSKKKSIIYNENSEYGEGKSMYRYLCRQKEFSNNNLNLNEDFIVNRNANSTDILYKVDTSLLNDLTKQNCLDKKMGCLGTCALLICELTYSELTNFREYFAKIKV